MSFQPGAEFAGYTLVRSLGAGAVGEVYLARDPGIDRCVALKIWSKGASDPNFPARFKAEARVVGQLDHPNIVPIHAFGTFDNLPWMAMRFLEGGDLTTHLSAADDLSRGISILKDIAAALDFAHAKGLVHRNLKPSNILLAESGQAYLADLSIDGSIGAYAGAADYLAPEQALGQQLGAYTDVYALAVISFRWLAGELPFRGPTPSAVMLKHITSPVPTELLAAHFSRDVCSVVASGLAKKPEDRFANAGTFIARLEDALRRSENSGVST